MVKYSKELGIKLAPMGEGRGPVGRLCRAPKPNWIPACVGKRPHQTSTSFPRTRESSFFEWLAERRQLDPRVRGDDETNENFG